VRSRFARCGSSTREAASRDDLAWVEAAMISARPQALGPRCAAALVHLLPLDLPATQQIAIALRITRQALLQHARAGARFDSDGHVVLLDDQDRHAVQRCDDRRGLAMFDKAVRHRQPGPYRLQAASSVLARTISLATTAAAEAAHIRMHLDQWTR